MRKTMTSERRSEEMTVARMCPMCGMVTEVELDVTMDQLFRYENGRDLIQDVFPNLSATEREYIKTGYCFDCQDILFAPME